MPLGTGGLAQVRLYLLGSVLADAKPGPDGADARHLADSQIGSEQLARRVAVPVQPGRRLGYGSAPAGQPGDKPINAGVSSRRGGGRVHLGYGVGLRTRCGYGAGRGQLSGLQLHALSPQLVRRGGIGYVPQGRPQEVSQRGPEAERHDRQAGDRGSRCTGPSPHIWPSPTQPDQIETAAGAAMRNSGQRRTVPVMIAPWPARPAQPTPARSAGYGRPATSPSTRPGSPAGRPPQPASGHGQAG